MEWIINNWYLILAFSALGIVVGYNIKNWFEKPTSEQIENIKQWLLYAVTEAEAQLGGGTGQLKLRYVYDLAVERFKWISLIPFEIFEMWVDESLDQMRHLLKTNENIQKLVDGE